MGVSEAPNFDLFGEFQLYSGPLPMLCVQEL